MRLDRPGGGLICGLAERLHDDESGPVRQSPGWTEGKEGGVGWVAVGENSVCVCGIPSW